MATIFNVSDVFYEKFNEETRFLLDLVLCLVTLSSETLFVKLKTGERTRRGKQKRRQKNGQIINNSKQTKLALADVPDLEKPYQFFRILVFSTAVGFYYFYFVLETAQKMFKFAFHRLTSN